jgi:hypothetical protein
MGDPGPRSLRRRRQDQWSNSKGEVPAVSQTLGTAVDQIVGHYEIASARSEEEFRETVDRLGRKVRRRVHECVFAVLALESEPVDPRL